MLFLLLATYFVVLNGALTLSDIPLNGNWADDIESSSADQASINSATVGIGRHLGHGYDILYGDPFSVTLDSGLKRNSLLPPKVIQISSERNATCPNLSQCFHRSPDQLEVVEITVNEKDHDDAQSAALEHITLYGRFSTNISSGFGLLTKRARETSLRLEDGVLSVEHIRLAISQESKLDFRLTKHLHPSFVTAICGLPLEYHYDEYVNVIKEFGTHVVVRVRQAVVSSNRTLVNSTMLLQTANDLGVDIAHAEKNGVAGFDRTAISTRLLQKAAEKYGFRESSSPEYVLPVVVDLYELPYFVTSERLATSESEAGECFSILRSADAPESTTDKKVEQLRGNLQRALVEYVRLSRQRTIPKNETDGFVPWPNQGSKKQAKHICGDDFRSHSGKAHLLGVGYDIFRGDPFAPAHDTGFFPLPHLLVQDRRILGSNKTDTSVTDLCSETVVSQSLKYRTQVWNLQEFVDELKKHYNFLDPLPVEVVPLLSTESQSMANARAALFPDGQNLLSDLIAVNASFEVLLKYHAVDGLASEFVHALCGLPVTYQRGPYISLLKEFGTHIVTKIRIGNFSFERIVLQKASLVRKMLDEEQTRQQKRTAIFDPNNLSTGDIVTAGRRFLQQHDLDSSVHFQQLPTITRNDEPVLLTLRDISYFVTLERLASSVVPEDKCSHLLQNESNVDVLSSNLVKALANYAEELLPPRTTTTPDSAATPTVLTTPTTTTTAAATTIELVPTIDTTTTTTTTTTSTTTPTRTTTSTTTKHPVVTQSMFYQPQPNRKSVWPAGSYALLEPTEGCPSTQWERGSRLQDTEDDGYGNSWSTDFAEVTTAKLSGGGVQLGFCVKPNPFFTNEPEWPSGSYCIFKKGDCPRGFSTSYVHFDDEDHQNHNGFSGTLPDGIFGKDTRYFFCCRDDGNPIVPIELPTQHPFIMMRNAVQEYACQMVEGMNATPFSLLVDCENSHNGCHASTFGDSLPGFRKYNGDFRWDFCYYKRSPMSPLSRSNPFRSLLDYIDNAPILSFSSVFRGINF
ncbi:hypothetical protein RvY_01464 [Ramazzottius varieornatus]|uniref:MACPF domain-containing protein n=1 Tax=Ramazzottius varieornatus TaxID=947166 RepID=A0A1D1UGE4_RAMVA|nr:hypothetical protein RvY_01464 [Ramazzottius varieornatus]